MASVDNIILSTDWDTLKNDDADSGSFTIPGSQNIPASSNNTSALIYNLELAVGEAESLLNVRIRNNKEGLAYFLASVQLSFMRTGTAAGNPATYSMYFFATHVDLKTVRFTVIIPNPYNVTLTTASGDEIFDILVRTIKQPNFA